MQGRLWLTYFSSMVNLRFMPPVKWLCAVLVLLILGCKSPEEKLEGNWQIAGYSYQGIESMSQIKRANMDGLFQITIVDNGEDYFAMIKHTNEADYSRDTIHAYSGKWFYDKPILKFEFNGYAVGSRGKTLYSTEKDTTTRKLTIPYHLIQGTWEVEKEGKNSLKLKRADNGNVKLELKRL